MDSHRAVAFMRFFLSFWCNTFEYFSINGEPHSSHANVFGSDPGPTSQRLTWIGEQALEGQTQTRIWGSST